MRGKGLIRVAFLVFIAVAFFALPSMAATRVKLDGHSLTIEEVLSVSKGEAEVEITDEAMKQVEAGFAVIMEAALQGKPVYGLTTGVGWNKDKPVFEEKNGKRVLSEELLTRSRKFNLLSLRAHGGGVGPDLPADVVRAAMLIRLNTFLSGIPGVQPAVVNQYRDFLNKKITPVVPSRGSVGEADITIASHIGLAMVGEWQVDYKGKRMAAADALKEAGLSPIEPVGKDFLSMLSTNAVAAGQAVLAVEEAKNYVDKAIAVFGLTLEGLNGNVAPFLKATTEIRPFPGMLKASQAILDVLNGSYLWQPAEGRPLQDPLSFRTMGYALGNALEAIEEANNALIIQINSTDDNPAVIPGATTVERADSKYVSNYLVKGEQNGAIYPTANFDMLPVVARIERLSQALARLSQNIVMQTIRFENPNITGLSRFLASEENTLGHAFGAIQKPLVELYAENEQLAMPVSMAGFALAGNIEDTFVNSLLAIRNLEKITDNMYHISSIQMLHTAQAIDLRGKVHLANKTKALYDGYRKVVPFVSLDRIYTSDFAKGYEFLKSYTVK
jgi:histidine ammonia-lyase